MMQEEAVSPVLAAMLVFAVLITFISVFQGVIIPQMKAQAEVEHLGKVEEAFSRFASDIETVVALKRKMTLSERIPLGGGDIPLSAVKSAGTIQLTEVNFLTLTLANRSPFQYNLTNISYSPVSNFWQDQGYSWQYGYVNITRGAISAPLDFDTMSQVESNLQNFSADLIEIKESTPSIIDINITHLIEGDSDYISGNKIAKLKLDSISLDYDSLTNFLIIEISKNLPEYQRIPLMNKLTTSLFGIPPEITETMTGTKYQWTFSSAVTVRVHEHKITLTAQ